MVLLRIEDTTSADIAAALERLDAILVEELRRANTDVGMKLEADSKRILQYEVYNIPIPLTRGADRKLGAKAKVRVLTTKGKHGKWSRTGNLKRGESFRLSEAGQGSHSVELTNNANYSAARAALGGPPDINPSGRRAGVQRPQPRTPDQRKSKTLVVGDWHRRAYEQNRAWVQARYAAAIQRALRRTGE